jgi:hypothetical protein
VSPAWVTRHGPAPDHLQIQPPVGLTGQRSGETPCGTGGSVALADVGDPHSRMVPCDGPGQRLKAG